MQLLNIGGKVESTVNSQQKNLPPIWTSTVVDVLVL